MAAVCDINSAYAISRSCQACVMFNACAIMEGYDDYFIGYTELDEVVNTCSRSVDTSNLDSDTLQGLAGDAVTMGKEWAYVISSGASNLEIYQTRRTITMHSVYQCFGWGYCDFQTDFCHQENGAEYVNVALGTFGSEGLACAKCPSPGVFDGENAPYVGYPLGYSSCGITNDTTFSDSRGSGVYSSTTPCMYELSESEMEGGIWM